MRSDDGTRTSKEYTEALRALREQREAEDEEYWQKGDPAKYAIAKADRDAKKKRDA